MTQAGLMGLKKALTECDGDFEKAKDYLARKGSCGSRQKAGRIAAEGIFGGFVESEFRRWRNR